jgi:hypothetical protein
MKAVRLTVTTGQQVTEYVVGQILDFYKRRAERLVNIIRSHYFGTGIHTEGASGSDEALTKVAVMIREFEHRHAWLQPVFLASDPLLGTAARP